MGTLRQRVIRLLSAALLAALAGCFGGGDDDSADAGSLIGPSLQARALVVNGALTNSAHLVVPLDADVPAGAFVNVVIDLDGDGRWRRYPLAGGAVQEEWVVRNLPLTGAAGSRSGFYFRLVDGTALTRSGLTLRAIVTAAPLPVDGEWDGRPPAGVLAMRTLPVTIGDEQWTLVDNPFGTVGDDSVDHGKDMPDLQQPVNSFECAPTASANSLRWLAKQDPEGFRGKLPASDRDLIDELKKDMKHNVGRLGVDPQNILPGKLAFNKRHELPIESHQVGRQFDPDLFMKIFEELKKGQDVELVVRKDGTNNQHMVTVVGAAISSVNPDTTMTLTIRDSERVSKQDEVHPAQETLQLFWNGLDQHFYIEHWRGGSGLLEYAFADSPLRTTAAGGTTTTPTPSTPGTVTPTTTTPGTSTSTVTPTPSTPGTGTTTTTTTGTTTPTGTVTPSNPPTNTTTTAIPPAPAPQLVLLGPTSFNVVHIRGVTACPTPIGTILVQNSGTAALAYSVANIPLWMNALNAAGTLSPGASAELALQFICANFVLGSQAATLQVQGRDPATGAAAGAGEVSVGLEVR